MSRFYQTGLWASSHAYIIRIFTEPCAWDYTAMAWPVNGDLPEGYTFNWTAANEAGEQLQGTGTEFPFWDIVHATGLIRFDLQIVSPCGTVNLAAQEEIEACTDPDHERSVSVSPNPAQTQITVTVTDLSTGADYAVTDLNGDEMIIRTVNGWQNLINTRLYYNRQSVNVSGLPNGYYNLIVKPSGSAPVSTTFSILR